MGDEMSKTLMDWIGHHCDIAHWGLDMDQTGGPLEIESSEGVFPPAMTKTASKLKWDAEKEVILDDPEASKLLTRPFRGPWKLA